MHRFRLSALVLVCLGLTAGSLAVAVADPPDPLPPGADKIIAEKLAVQTAMLQGRDHLRQGDPARAVAVLEGQLARIEGSKTYLLLQEAYQTYVAELYVHKQEQQARKYLERLRILDPRAAAALEIGPTGPAAAARPAPVVPTSIVANPAPPASSGPAPQIAGQVPVPPRYVSPLRQATEAARPQTTVRGLMGDDRRPNPFSKDFEMPRLGAAPGGPKASELLARARVEFTQGRYGPARVLLEQARQADPHLPADSADQLAYCKLNYAFQELEKGSGATAADLKREVQDALDLCTSPKLKDFGLARLLDRIGQRPAGGAAVSVRHYADGRSGLQVAESAHFRVFHKLSPEYAERAVAIAERTRLAMSRKWLGHDGGDWQPKCDLFLYATAAEYTQATGQPAVSPGHTRIETDPATGRVVSRRMHLRRDFPGMLEAVLPHETTHVVIAGQFGSRPVPRWVDEGIAVLAEPAEKVGQHRRNLARAGRERDLFGARELMELPDYPQPRRISTFYAQSVSLVDYLSRQKGPQEFCQFVRDGLREGYESSLRRHYGYRDFADLEARWHQDAVAGLGTAAPAFAGR